MFAAFASAKVQAARSSKSYGDGGAFTIGGGSHASGNDTSLGVHNGAERKVERGEMVTVFSKAAVNKYGAKKLSGVVAAVNQKLLQTVMKIPTMLITKC